MRDGRLPKAGDIVSVSGFPTTDMFILRLESAVWRPSKAVVDDAPVVPVSVKTILSISRDERKSYTEYYGRRVRLRGRVLEEGPSAESFAAEGSWKKVIGQVKPGDRVVLRFPPSNQRDAFAAHARDQGGVVKMELWQPPQPHAGSVADVGF